MSGPTIVAVDQPDSFAFSSDVEPAVDKVINKYPDGRQASAVLPLLDLAQRQHGGWVPQAAIEHIAERLGMAKIRVMEVASFYTMINLAPVGKYHLQVCGTTPCMLRGSDDVFRAIRDELGIGHGESTDDGIFTCTEVECLGACVNAPMVQVNDDFVEDLDYDNFTGVLRTLKNGGALDTGSQTGRHSSEPEGGALTLSDVPTPQKFDPSKIYGGGDDATDEGGGASVKESAPGTPATPEATKAKVEKAEEGEAETKNVPGASDAEAQVSAKTDDDASTAKKPASPSLDDEDRPDALDGPRGGAADELTRIKGIGPKIEGILHTLGIFHFDQIAAWTPAEKDWVNGYLKFKGRIDREKWIEQAKDFMAENSSTGGGA